MAGPRSSADAAAGAAAGCARPRAMRPPPARRRTPARRGVRRRRVSSTWNVRCHRWFAANHKVGSGAVGLHHGLYRAWPSEFRISAHAATRSRNRACTVAESGPGGEAEACHGTSGVRLEARCEPGVARRFSHRGPPGPERGHLPRCMGGPVADGHLWHDSRYLQDEPEEMGRDRGPRGSAAGARVAQPLGCLAGP